MATASSTSVREFHQRIRELCVRVVATEGADYQMVLIELANLIELAQTAEYKNGNENPSQARRAGQA